MKTGIELIAEERQEQIHKHDFSLELDAGYRKELVQAAEYCLMLAEYKRYKNGNLFWPTGWDMYFEHKIINKTKVEKLIVAGAFFMAENDRRGNDLFSSTVAEIAAEIDRLNHQSQ